MKKQKPWLGFSLALLATMTWGSLPVIAQQALKAVDAPTLVWIRFLVASLVLFVLLGLTGKLPRPSEFSKQTLFLLVLGIIGISANFVLVAMGLHYISPTTTQVLWQLSPFTMILVGVGVFKEAFTHWQKIGLMLLLTGLVMFFNDKFDELFSLGSYAVGVMMAASGSMIWVCYGVAQKLLSKHFNSQQILLMIYFCSNPAHDLFLQQLCFPAVCRTVANCPYRQSVFMELLYLLLLEYADRLRFIRRSAQPLGRFKSQYRHHADSRVHHDIFHHRPSSRPRLFCCFGYEYRQLCGCYGGCGRGIAGCGRRESNGAFFEKDMKHLLQNRIKQGRLKQVSDGLYIF